MPITAVTLIATKVCLECDIPFLLLLTKTSPRRPLLLTLHFAYRGAVETGKLVKTLTNIGGTHYRGYAVFYFVIDIDQKAESERPLNFLPQAPARGVEGTFPGTTGRRSTFIPGARLARDRRHTCRERVRSASRKNFRRPWRASVTAGPRWLCRRG